MSPQAGELLIEQIAPRLRASIPRVVRPVGAEDSEELVQDAITVAAQMLQRIEACGKQVTPGNIAYYVILHMRSGRRSHTAGRTDVMTAATQLDRKSCVLSTEEEVGYDPELDEAITLGSLLAVAHDDPAQAGARNIDWDTFLASHDYRYGVIVQGMIDGQIGSVGDSYDRYLMRMEEIKQSVPHPTTSLRHAARRLVVCERSEELSASEDERDDENEELIHHFIIHTEGDVYFGAENTKGELGFYIYSKGGGTPYRLKIRSPSFINLSILPKLLPGHMMSDVVSILGSLDFVMGECDR